MNQWHRPEDKLPEQGKKILCEDSGDFYVAQRFKEYWFQIPFTESKFSHHYAPVRWQEINFPEPYTGYVRVMIDGKMMTMDELETCDPEFFYTFVEGHLKLYNSTEKYKKKGRGS